AVLLVGFGTALLLWPRDRITAESWKQIRIGMTEDEVAEILGAPGTSQEHADAQYEQLEKRIGRPPGIFHSEGEGVLAFRGPVKFWIGRRGFLRIGFDDCHVKNKLFLGFEVVEPIFIDRLRDWLGW